MQHASYAFSLGWHACCNLNAARGACQKMTSTVQYIRDFMTASPVTISPELMIPDATERMYTYGIRHLPVVENGMLVGVISDRDTALAPNLFEREASEITVRQAMRRNPFMCQASDRIIEVVGTMIRKKIGSAIVLDGNRVVGVFTTIDAMSRLIDLCRLIELMGSAPDQPARA